MLHRQDEILAVIRAGEVRFHLPDHLFDREPGEVLRAKIPAAAAVSRPMPRAAPVISAYLPFT